MLQPVIAQLVFGRQEERTHLLWTVQDVSVSVVRTQLSLGYVFQ